MFGTIRAITRENIVLALPPKPPAPQPAERSLALDPKTTEVFDTYVGEPVETAAMSALSVGMVVGVTLEDGKVSAITIPHDAVTGTLIEIHPDSVTIEPPHDPKLPPVRQTFSLDDKSKFLLGRETGQTKLPNGKTRRYYVYNPGGSAADLKVGQSVTFTVRMGRILTMRIMPRPTTQPATRPGQITSRPHTVVFRACSPRRLASGAAGIIPPHHVQGLPHARPYSLSGSVRSGGEPPLQMHLHLALYSHP